MVNEGNQSLECSQRRQRLHDLVVALIQHQDDLELMDLQAPCLDRAVASSLDQDPGRWLDRNRRVLNKYQALVRSAITLDALLDAEQTT